MDSSKKPISGSQYTPLPTNQLQGTVGYGPPVTGPTGGYGPPVTGPTSGYGPPATGPTSGYGPPATGPASGYGPPATGSTNGYGPPATGPTSGYGPPTTGPASGYGPPATGPTNGYGPPANGLATDGTHDEAKPSAPTMDIVIAGYENINSNTEGFSDPPPQYDHLEMPSSAYKDQNNQCALSDDEARAALQQYVSEHCCYGKEPVVKMSFEKISSSSALHYTLETFVETRTTKWSKQPYRGGFVDGPENGVPPRPWDLAYNPQNFFINETCLMEVPHTAVVKRCTWCSGNGTRVCSHCHGSRTTRCTLCSGRDCTKCHGRGFVSCSRCSGRGVVQCKECGGAGSNRHFILLTIKFTNLKSSHVIEMTDLPDVLIKDVSGKEIFNQAAVMVPAVLGFPNREIDDKSQMFVDEHQGKCKNMYGRILQQKQVLQEVPVFECEFKYKDSDGRFWVYGLENKVFTEDYPQTCCGCCCII